MNLGFPSVLILSARNTQHPKELCASLSCPSSPVHSRRLHPWEELVLGGVDTMDVVDAKSSENKGGTIGDLPSLRGERAVPLPPMETHKKL